MSALIRNLNVIKLNSSMKLSIFSKFDEVDCIVVGDILL